MSEVMEGNIANRLCKEYDLQRKYPRRRHLYTTLFVASDCRLVRANLNFG